MTDANSIKVIRDTLLRIGYPEAVTENIENELNKLFDEINFEAIRLSSDEALKPGFRCI